MGCGGFHCPKLKVLVNSYTMFANATMQCCTDVVGLARLTDHGTYVDQEQKARKVVMSDDEMDGDEFMGTSLSNGVLPHIFSKRGSNDGSDDKVDQQRIGGVKSCLQLAPVTTTQSGLQAVPVDFKHRGAEMRFIS